MIPFMWIPTTGRTNLQCQPQEEFSPGIFGLLKNTLLSNSQVVNTWSPRVSSPTEWEPLHHQSPVFSALSSSIRCHSENDSPLFIQLILTCLCVYPSSVSCLPWSYVYVPCLFYRGSLLSFLSLLKDPCFPSV